MNFTTADLYDQHEEVVQVAVPLFNDYGGRKKFGGAVTTVKVFEDNTLVRTTLEEAGQDRILIVDGGGSLRCALVGDRLAELGYKNNWQGIIVYGCIRDAPIIATIDIGLKALNTNPRRSVKKSVGTRDCIVHFADVAISPNDYLYADEDGIVIASKKLC